MLLDPEQLAAITPARMHAVVNSMNIVNPVAESTPWPIVAQQVTHEDIRRASGHGR